MSRAIHIVANEAHLLAMRTVGIFDSPPEEIDWRSLRAYAQGLIDLADRGIYHAATSPERLKEINNFAMRNYPGECEAR